MKDCLSSVNFLVLVSGTLRGKFNDSRGVRQRDPLSPFLFTLVADGLGRLVDLAQSIGLLACFVIGKELVEFSHLQFADNNLFFARSEKSSLNNLVRLLDAFCLVFG